MSKKNTNKTAEQILNERRENHRAYMRKYRAEHPEYTYKCYIQSAVRILTRNGYTVTAPDGSECK